ncbi:PIG-L family deacetylase, partial [Patescibacteria group bacterium]|nr:PIG-L family deacetylase [Patescibacteria group bacterium]
TLPQKELNDSISKCVQRVNPDIVFVSFYGDINKDHKLVSEAVLVAVRPKPNLSIKKVYCYEVLSETEWAKPSQKIEDVFIPNFYEDISDYLKDKLKAMECYKSELKDYPHPRSLEGIKVLAQKRGMECGAKAAEAFMLLREVVN